ncbi:hypothetical protein [Microbulbifer sp. THAF38]|uniref:hypothetical protein n=1 Tax=Microbulbifer sp. THAF38 TaxID=2587856 RepID=UPI001267B91B|nr:hypothetical protein [Microbulbifer sp. THAF38]QFT56079.1 hypothetical protein FIU95_16140 [Microbulbifer sp. THAF38]
MKNVKSLGNNDKYELLVRHGGCGYPYTQENVRKIYDYLEESPCAVPFLGVRHCPFGCEDLIYESYHTDGTWIWQKGLLHYFTHHYIEMPELFLNHILGSEVRPSCPESLILSIESSMLSGGVEKRIDGTFWGAWFSKFLNKDKVETVYFVKSPYRKNSRRKAPPGSFSGWSDFEL